MGLEMPCNPRNEWCDSPLLSFVFLHAGLLPGGASEVVRSAYRLVVGYVRIGHWQSSKGFASIISK